jgi:hypothetical protein
MTSKPREALREKVVMATKAVPLNGQDPSEYLDQCFYAAIDVALEEAARVAADDGHSHGCNCEYCYGREHAAAAIRAMKEKD